MELTFLTPLFALLLIPLEAAEHHGVVRFGGFPVPGATVTATQSGKRFTAVTSQQGFYSFADLPDGRWSIQVEMLCFAPLKRDVAVAPGALLQYDATRPKGRDISETLHSDWSRIVSVNRRSHQIRNCIATDGNLEEAQTV